jgi:hypothetical protein
VGTVPSEICCVAQCYGAEPSGSGIISMKLTLSLLLKRSKCDLSGYSGLGGGETR